MEMVVNSQRLFILLYSHNSSLLSLGLYHTANTFIAIEALVLLTCVLFTTFNIYLTVKKPKFHFNLTVLLTFMVGMYYPVAAARLVLILFQVEYLDAEGSLIETYLLIVASSIRMHYISLMILTGFIILAERSCASYYVQDYERTSRPHIPIILIFLSLIVSVTLTFLRVFCIFSTLELAITVVVVQSLAFMMFVNEHRMYRRRRNILIQPDQYSLSMRFQIDENHRILNLLRHILAGIIVLSTLMALVIVFRMFIGNEVIHGIANACIEICISGLPLVVYLICIFRIPEWKFILLRMVSCGHSTYRKPKQVDNFLSHTAVYFGHLEATWK